MCLKLQNLSNDKVISLFFPIFFCRNRDWIFVVCKVLFGEENVGLLIGDAIVNREALILIMTIEIFCNMFFIKGVVLYPSH